MNLQNKSSLFLVLVFALAISFWAKAQTEAEKFTAKHLVYLELAGNAGQYAFNYGHLFYQKGVFKLTGSAGFSLWADPIEGSTIWNPALPLEVSALMGKRNHHLELGLGITPYLKAEINSSFETGVLVQSKGPNNLAAVLPLRIGYRYQKPEGGFWFRVGYTPFFSLPYEFRDDWEFQPIFAGIGFGWSF